MRTLSWVAFPMGCAVIVFGPAGCGTNGGSKPIESSTRNVAVSDADAVELEEVCSYATDSLASTAGTTCDLALTGGLSSCVSDLQAKGQQVPACAPVRLGQLLDCVDYMAEDPCMTGAGAAAACNAASACIGDDGGNNNQGGGTETGIASGTLVDDFSGGELTTICEYISDGWSGTAATSCDISFDTVAACIEQIELRRASGTCADASIEDMERCTTAFSQDSCSDDLTTLNQTCGYAIDCLIPRG